MFVIITNPKSVSGQNIAVARFIRLAIGVLYCGLAAWSAVTFAHTIQPGSPYPVGMKQLEHVEPGQGGRHLALALFYPAVIPDASAAPLRMSFFTNLHLYKDAEIV